MRRRVERLIPSGDGRWERPSESTTSDFYPHWSPDGKRIAFGSARKGSEDVWVMDLETRGLTRLTDAPGRDFAPAWFPDGKRIAFVADRAASWRDRLVDEPDLDVWMMDADGGRQRQMTANEGYRPLRRTATMRSALGPPARDRQSALIRG